MSFPDKCDGCGIDYDFMKYASGRCNFHKKDFCYTCALKKPCAEGKLYCTYTIITNPQWIINLKKSGQI